MWRVELPWLPCANTTIMERALEIFQYTSKQRCCTQHLSVYGRRHRCCTQHLSVYGQSALLRCSGYFLATMHSCFMNYVMYTSATYSGCVVGVWWACIVGAWWVHSGCGVCLCITLPVGNEGVNGRFLADFILHSRL